MFYCMSGYECKYGKNLDVPLVTQCRLSCADPEGWGGGAGGPELPWKITKNIGLLSNTYTDPLKNIATKPAFNVGHHQLANKTRFNGVSLASRWWPVYSLSPHQLKKRCQCWALSDKTFWIRAWN